MLSRLIKLSFCLLVSAVLIGSFALAAKPVIKTFMVPESTRVMDKESMGAIADGQGDPRPLVYQWTIVAGATGAETLDHPDSSTAILNVRWRTEAEAPSAVGKSIRLQLEVAYKDAVPGQDESDIRVADIPVTGINRRPSPVITGNLGTASDRLATGRAASVNCIDSTDPDGDGFQSLWGFGASRGGRYLRAPVLYGSEGAEAVFTVPDMTANIDQEMILQLIDGLHKVEARIWLYLKPSVAPPPNSGPTVSLNPSTLTVVKGGVAEFVATATDVDRNDLSFVWTFQSTTTNPAYFTSARSSETQWTSVLRYPTASLNPGSYQVSVKAVEATGAALVSAKEMGSLVVEAEKQNQPPSARIKHDHNGDGQFTYATSTSAVKTERRAVALNASGSTDDDGLANLTYQWSLTGAGPGTLSALQGPETAVSVPEGFEGQVKVNLLVRDAQGLTASASATFQFELANENPVAAIRFAEGEAGSLQGPVTPESTIEVSSRTLQLDGSASTDDGGQENLSYNWSAGGVYNGYLNSSTKSSVTLTMPESFSSSIKVTLTVRDAKSASGSTWVNFKFVQANLPPEARIQYDDDGDGFYAGPFDSGHTATAGSGTIALSAGASTDDGGLEQVQFLWSASGLEGASLSAASGKDVILTVPPGAEGTVKVGLTAEDAGGKSSNAELNLVFSAVATGNLTAAILGAPEEVEVGREFHVEGSVEGDVDPENLVYEWRAEDGDGQPVEVFSSGSRAKITAPGMTADSASLQLQFRARQGVLASDWATREVSIIGPRLFFSQLGVGRIPGTQLRFETCMVLVNGSEQEAHVRMVFVNNQLGENWSVNVDGEMRSDMSFTIQPGGARKFLLGGEQIGFGWMKLSANVKLAGHLFYRVIDLTTGKTHKEVPILPVVGRSFRTALDPGINGELALALVNVADTEVRFRVVVTSQAGASLETADLVLQPGEHFAKFLPEIFDGKDYSLVTIPSGFAGGTLQILAEGEGARLVATILKTDGGLPQSILPVVVQD